MHMEIKRLSPADLPLLLSNGRKPALSIYLPLEAPGGDLQADAIRIKNALRDADRTLADAGLDKREREPYLSALQPLGEVHDRRTWNGAAGICALVRGDGLELRSSPVAWDEMVTVGARYQVLPAIPFCRPLATAFVLALSLKQARLLSVTRFEADEITLPDETPKSFAESASGQREEQHLQYHSSGGNGTGPIYHGQGGGKDNVQPEIEHYCRQVARGVDMRLREHTAATLIVAGDVQLTSVYRHAAAHELAGTIPGNFDQASGDELREQVASRLEQLERREVRDTCARFASLELARPVSGDETELHEAAIAGRVSDLLIEAELAPIRLDVTMKPPDSLANSAAVATLEHGGKVLLVPPGDFPNGDGKLAAIYRY
jgi:hypothetical protein